MGQITEALNKIQKSRKENQEKKSFDYVPVSGIRQFNSKIVVIAIIVAIVIVSVFISVVIIALDIGGTKSNQNQILTLEKSLKLQDKEINDLFSFLINTNSLSDNQIQNLNSRLKNEIENRKNQVDHLALIDNVYYLNLVKSTLSNTHQINFLDKYTKDLNSKIEKSSAVESQAKDLKIPASGN
jgi:hypothetical protein